MGLAPARRPLRRGRPVLGLYREIVRGHLATAGSLLDLGTGGGELLSSLGPLPARTAATEGYPPNVPVARRNLEPLGVEVADTTDLGDAQAPLPFPDRCFDLVINRHEGYAAAEVWRVLVPGGWFVTQQVGGREIEELNATLAGPPSPYRGWDLATAAAELAAAGFEIREGREERIPAAFHDIGAVLLYLRIAPWQVPDFDLGRYDGRLRALHAELSTGPPLAVTSHRFLLTARRAG